MTITSLPFFYNNIMHNKNHQALQALNLLPFVYRSMVIQSSAVKSVDINSEVGKVLLEEYNRLNTMSEDLLAIVRKALE